MAKVRDLTDTEKLRVRECLTWMNAQPNLDDPETYRKILDEARNRWADVAELIGFDED